MMSSYSLIHDKMNHAKIALARLQVCSKMISRLKQLSITLMGMIVHCHGDEKYAQYFNEFGQTIPISQLVPYCNCCGF